MAQRPRKDFPGTGPTDPDADRPADEELAAEEATLTRDSAETDDDLGLTDAADEDDDDDDDEEIDDDDEAAA